MKLALIGYHGNIFLSTARALESSGIQIHWINGRHSWSERLRGVGYPETQICDVAPPEPIIADQDQAVSILAPLETYGPNVRDIILMDRYLRLKPYGVAVRYLAGVASKVEDYLIQAKVDGISSGRDTAIQIVVMLVARKLGIRWGAVTYTKYPRNGFFLSRDEVPTTILPVGGRPTEVHFDKARAFIQSFRGAPVKPMIRTSSTGFGDVVRALPNQLRAVAQELSLQRQDHNNDIARPTFKFQAKTFVRKRWNLAMSKRLELNYDVKEPFVLTGLHRQPESSIDVSGRFFSNQLASIATLARAVPVSHSLAIKIHLSDVDGQPPSFYRTLNALPGITLVHPAVDTFDLVKRAALVVGNSGAMQLEAGLLGRPAISFAPMHYCELPTVTYCPTPASLSKLVREKIAETPPASVESGIENFMARIFANAAMVLPNKTLLGGGDYSENETVELIRFYRAFLTMPWPPT